MKSTIKRCQVSKSCPKKCRLISFSDFFPSLSNLREIWWTLLLTYAARKMKRSSESGKSIWRHSFVSWIRKNLILSTFSFAWDTRLIHFTDSDLTEGGWRCLLTSNWYYSTVLPWKQIILNCLVVCTKSIVQIKVTCFISKFAKNKRFKIICEDTIWAKKCV